MSVAGNLSMIFFKPSPSPLHKTLKNQVEYFTFNIVTSVVDTLFTPGIPSIASYFVPLVYGPKMVYVVK